MEGQAKNRHGENKKKMPADKNLSGETDVRSGGADNIISINARHPHWYYIISVHLSK